MRAMVLLLFVCIANPIAVLAKSEPERFAAIAVVEHTGEVLHARHADALRHPASLAKVMTLYMTFAAIEAGELGWDDQLRVSSRAARAQPSKLGLKADSSISVENAVRALVTKSANDAAIVLAERLSGGEARFAAAMTKKARALGMSHTRFMNASGLPNRRQVITAREMAVLAYRIHHDFPAEYRYFSLQKMIWKGREHGNHNTLLEQIDGVDGLKTGFTNASGYNIAVTAERDDQRLIVIVFGGASGAQRDAYASKLLERAFAELHARQSDGSPTQNQPLDDLNDKSPILFAGLPSEVDQGAGGKRGVQIIIDDAIESKKLVTEKPAIKAAPALNNMPDMPGQSTAAGWGIQVGAYSSARKAQERLHHISDISINGLNGNAGKITEGMRKGAPLYRVQYRGLGAQGARAVCKELNAFGEACFALPPAIITASNP